MAEGKEYITRAADDGSVSISEDVVGIIALEAMREVEGFGAVAGAPGKDLAELIGMKNTAKGVRVTNVGESVTIDVFVCVRYGCSVTQVSCTIQERVKKAVEDMTGISVSAVHVHVGGITFEKTK